jgi:hypothetical protein
MWTDTYNTGDLEVGKLFGDRFKLELLKSKDK